MMSVIGRFDQGQQHFYVRNVHLNKCKACACNRNHPSVNNHPDLLAAIFAAQDFY